MFPFPGYHPRNYQPGQATEAAPTFTERQRAAAVDARAEWISRDGGKCYRFRLKRWEWAEWDGFRYESYWPMGEGELEEPGDRPKEAVKL